MLTKFFEHKRWVKTSQQPLWNRNKPPKVTAEKVYSKSRNGKIVKNGSKHKARAISLTHLQLRIISDFKWRTKENMTIFNPINTVHTAMQIMFGYISIAAIPLALTL